MFLMVLPQKWQVYCLLLEEVQLWEQILSSKPSLAAATSSSSAAHTPDGPNSVGNLELMKQIQERQLLLVVIYRR